MLDILPQLVLPGLKRLASLRLHVSAGEVELLSKRVFRVHAALTRVDLAESLAAHAIGLDVAKQQPGDFGESVTKAARFRLLPPIEIDTPLPIEQIQPVINDLSRVVMEQECGIFWAGNTIHGTSNSLTIHISTTEETSFASHIALMAGIASRQIDPITFERISRVALSRLTTRS